MNTPRNPILIGQVEVIDLVLPAVRAMLQRQGVYLASDSARSGYTVPLVVNEEGVWSMQLDVKLEPERFRNTVRIAGPFFAPGEEIPGPDGQPASAPTTEVHAPSGVDPADPWRGLYAPELMPKLDGVDTYHVAHPDLPSWPKDEDEERGISPLVKAQGFELEAVFGEYPEDDDEDPDYCAWLAQWTPTPPAGDHWRLACIQDTEDGPAAFYVRPFALIDVSAKGGSDASALRRALAEYADKNTHQLQARKVCTGVLALAESYSTEAQATGAEVQP